MSENSIMLGTSAVKIIFAVEQFDTTSIDAAKQIYKQLIEQGVIKRGLFEDDVWHTTDEYSNKLLEFTFNEFLYLKWYKEVFNMEIASFIEYVKVFTIYLFGKLVLTSIQGILADLKRIIKTNPEEIFGLNADLTIIYPNAIGDFLSFLPGSGENERINEMQAALDEYAYIREKKSDNARHLAQYESYFLFNDIIEHFWKNCDDEETRLFYYPIYLWWKLTTILPTRPREFLLTQRNCLEKKEDGYYLTLRKDCLKGSKKSVTYKISTDYKEVEYRIPNEMGLCIEKYLAETAKYASTQLNTLFIADTHYRKWKRKKNKNSRFLTYVNMRTILRYFFQEIIEGKYGIKVLYEKNDSHLKDGTIEYFHLGDARHIALINLMLQGGTPMLAMFLAGHDSEEMSFHYSTNLTTLIECNTYRQYRLITGGNVVYKISHSNVPVTPNHIGVPLKDGGNCFSAVYQVGELSDCLSAIGPEGEIGYCPACLYHRNGGNYWSSASIYKRRIADTCTELKEAVKLVRKQKGSGEEIGEVMLRLKDVSLSYAKYLEETKREEDSNNGA